jgi:hypothetical protein
MVGIRCYSEANTDFNTGFASPRSPRGMGSFAFFADT